MTLRSYLTHPPTRSSPWFRFGMLILLGIFLGFAIYTAAIAPPNYTGDPYAYIVISFTLLIQHIAFRFHFPPRPTLILRLIAIASALFVILYITYLSRALHIRH